MKNFTESELHFGEVFLVDFPFTNLQQSKLRPAVVVSSPAYHRHKPDAVFIAITSQLPANSAVGEINIQNWRETGLELPSVLKSVIATIHRSLVYERLGALSDQDTHSLRQLISKIFG